MDGWVAGWVEGWIPTSRHKEDSSAEQDVVFGAVDASDGDTKATQHQQDGAEDGEQARRAHDTCLKETRCNILNVKKKKENAPFRTDIILSFFATTLVAPCWPNDRMQFFLPLPH